MDAPRLAVWMGRPYLGDAMFDPSSPLNRDDCLAPVRLLRSTLQAAGGACHTYDVYVARGERPDVVLFFDTPPRHAASTVPPTWRDVPRWVQLLESEVVLPRNWDRRRQAEFELVFTWRDPLVDDRRFRKLNLPNTLRPPPAETAPGPLRLLTMIAGHKAASHPLELYSARLDTIRWYERHHPDDFDLYGTGWDRPVVSGPYAPRTLLGRTPLAPLLTPRRPSYRGRVVTKADTLGGYRFAVCYENARDIPGYITEKLFDCLTAGVVPIYWGPSDIDRHVPPDCFVDRRRFPSHEALHDHLAAMSDDARHAHLDAARSFLSSPAARPFSAEAWVDGLLEPMRERERGRRAPVG